jgi:hypothetical protein
MSEPCNRPCDPGFNPYQLHVVRVDARCYVVAAKDPVDPRLWWALAGKHGTAHGRLSDLPTLAGVRVFRCAPPAQRYLDGR